MRISDWSSEVCSSDLELAVARIERAGDVLAMGIVIFLDLRDKYRLGLDFGSGTHARADAHNLHLSMDGALVHLLKRRRHLRQALGHGEHLGFEAFDRKGAICKPRFHRLDAGEIIAGRSEEHTSELQSLMRNSYAVSS